MKNISLRYLAKQILPPVVVNIIKLLLAKTNNKIGFDYGYSSWDAAEKAARGYDEDVIFEKVAASARLVFSGEAIYERDSVIFDEVEYSWPLLASLLLAAATKNNLRVIDFGGSLGTTFQQNKRYLNRLPFACQWRVVEQEKFVEIGKNEFTNENLSFYKSIEDAGGRRRMWFFLAVPSATLRILINIYSKQSILERNILFLTEPQLHQDSKMFSPYKMFQHQSMKLHHLSGPSATRTSIGSLGPSMI